MPAQLNTRAARTDRESQVAIVCVSLPRDVLNALDRYLAERVLGNHNRSAAIAEAIVEWIERDETYFAND